MANVFSDFGGSIFYDGYQGETKVTLLADGTAKAGWLVGQTSGDGTARGVDTDGNLDEIDGIQAPRYDTDVDSAPTAGKAVDVYNPIAGKRYVIHITDPGAALYSGEPMNFGADAGALTKSGDIEGVHVARLAKNAANGDTYGVVTWGG